MDKGFNKDPVYIKDLLVVGAADVLTGDRWSRSGIFEKLDLPHMYGPGDNIVGVVGDKSKWASHDHGIEYKTTRGTSVGKFSPFTTCQGLDGFVCVNIQHVSYGIYCWNGRLFPEAAPAWSPPLG